MNKYNEVVLDTDSPDKHQARAAKDSMMEDEFEPVIITSTQGSQGG